MNYFQPPPGYGSPGFAQPPQYEPPFGYPPAPPGYAYDERGQLIQLPWGFGNPMHDALYTGEATIERTLPGSGGLPTWYGHQNDHFGRERKDNGGFQLVRKEDLLAKTFGNLIPKNDSGTVAFVRNDPPGSMARIEYEYAKSLIAYTNVLSPDEDQSLAVTDPSVPLPLNVLPVQASTSVPPVGGVVSVAELRFGHRGVQNRVFYDSLPGQIVKVPFAGSAGILNGRLYPKYYTPLDTVGPPHLRQYEVFPAGPILDNARWNELPPQILAQNGFFNPNAATFNGYFSEGNFANGDLLSKPTRRFYGTVRCDGVVADWPTRCPVAWYANAVMLLGARNNLEFIQNGPGLTHYGPFPVNTLIPLAENVQSIDVINSPVPIGGLLQVELPFELLYFLSF